MDVISVTLCNWDKFNPKDVQKTPSWFRVNINIVSSQTLFGLSTTAKWVWVCLLSEAMRKKASTFEVNIPWAAQQWALKKSDISKAIESLRKNGALLIVSEEAPSELRVDSALRTNERTNNTNEQHFDLAGLYKKYPRKEGKEKGMETLKGLVKNEIDFKNVSDAIDRYIQFCVREKKEKKFILHFSTFMNNISTWYDEDAGTVTLPKPKPIYYTPAPVSSSDEPRTLSNQDLRKLIKSVTKSVDDRDTDPGAA